MPVSLIGRFMLWSVFWLLGLMPLWYYLAPYLAAPAIELAGAVMDGLFNWVSGVERAGTIATLVTRIAVQVPRDNGYAMGELTPEANFLTYGYGVVLFWAAMLASRPQHLSLKLPLGTLALVPIQSWGLCFQWLKDIAFFPAPQAREYTQLQGWELDAIGLGYQLGYLVLTPLAPVLLWMLTDRRFIARLWIEMTLVGTLEKGTGDQTSQQPPSK
jgi:hypothetical protein